MALSSTKLSAITLGVVAAVTLGGVTYNQLTRETYSPNVITPSERVVDTGKVSAKCTGTGGVSNYDTCIVAPQLTSTGAISSIVLEILASPKEVGIDCSFVKSVGSATGSDIVNFGNKPTATGGRIVFSTGSLRWNSADYIKCGTLGTPTTSFSAVLHVKYEEDLSE